MKNKGYTHRYFDFEDGYKAMNEESPALIAKITLHVTHRHYCIVQNLRYNCYEAARRLVNEEFVFYVSVVC